MWSGGDCGMCSDAHLNTNPFADLSHEPPTPCAQFLDGERYSKIG